MEFIRISDGKIKVMLSEEDLRAFEITAQELDYSNTETKRMLWDILAHAKRLTGFDADGQKILVQLYPSRDGGCELFVTKLGMLAGAMAAQSEEERYVQEERALSMDANEVAPSAGHIVFSFSAMRPLLQACARLAALPYRSDSAAYRGESGEYYLILFEDGASRDLSGIPSLLREYGREEAAYAVRVRLMEHGSLICAHGAVQTLCEL